MSAPAIVEFNVTNNSTKELTIATCKLQSGSWTTEFRFKTLTNTQSSTAELSDDKAIIGNPVFSLLAAGDDKAISVSVNYTVGKDPVVSVENGSDEHDYTLKQKKFDNRQILNVSIDDNSNASKKPTK